MEHGGRGEAGQVEAPQLVGMIVADARQAGHEAGLVVISADPDGPLSAGSPGPGSGSSPLSTRCPEPGHPAGTTW